MPQERTEKSGFPSRFGGGWISASQWLAESMCDRMARKDGKTLGLKFWEKEPWKGSFMVQLLRANTLLKKYSVQAIVQALRSPRGKVAYSLGAKFLLPLIKLEQEKLRLQESNRETSPAQEPEAPPEVQSPRPEFVQTPSPLSKLRGL